MEIVEELRKFNSFLSELATLLNESGPSPERFRDGDGLVLAGWRYNSQDKTGEDRYSGSQYLGGWGGHVVDFLTVEGELYKYSYEWNEEKPGDEWIVTKSERLDPIPPGWLVGKGKPFSQAKREIEKLALQCKSSHKRAVDQVRPATQVPTLDPVQSRDPKELDIQSEPDGEAWNEWAIEEFRRDVRSHDLGRE